MVCIARALGKDITETDDHRLYDVRHRIEPGRGGDVAFSVVAERQLRFCLWHLVSFDFVIESLTFQDELNSTVELQRCTTAILGHSTVTLNATFCQPQA